MKKGIKISFIVVFIIIGGLMLYYFNYYSGSTYYVKIINTGKKIDKDIANSNKKFIDYYYSLDAYDNNGEKRKIEFYANKEEPLKLNAYLKLTYQENKGIMSWEEVREDEIPIKPLIHLDS